MSLRILVILIFFIATATVTSAQTRAVSGADGKALIKVDQPPSFPGGDKAYAKYLDKNFDWNVAKKSGAPKGEYQVGVTFLINKDGSVSNIKIETAHGYGMEEMVLKIIKSSPKWIPAKHAGRAVVFEKSMGFKFIVR